MSRPLRLEFQNALYHITSRGDRQEAIYKDDGNQEGLLEILGTVVTYYNWLRHGYCLMSNHYHLIIETLDANLSKGMRQLNGVYTRHQTAGINVVGICFTVDAKGSSLMRKVICSNCPAMSYWIRSESKGWFAISRIGRGAVTSP